MLTEIYYIFFNKDTKYIHIMVLHTHTQNELHLGNLKMENFIKSEMHKF